MGHAQESLTLAHPCRLRLPNARAIRLWQLLASIAYMAMLSYGQLVVLSDSLTPNVLIGECPDCMTALPGFSCSHACMRCPHLDYESPGIATCQSSAAMHAGLVVGYVFVAAAGWGTVAMFVPYLEKLLLDYSGILSLTLFLLKVLFVTLGPHLGLLSMNNHYTAMLVYVSSACGQGLL